MIKYIFIKELQSALLNKRLLFSCLILTVLMFVGGFVSKRQYISLKNEHEELMLDNNSKFDNIQKLRLFDVATLKQDIAKVPSNLSFISQNNKALPNGIEMNYFRMSIPQKFDSYNNYFRPFIALDWTNIIIYLFSFVCLCFAYNAFSGEKESGTLRLILSGSVSRWKILMGKLLSLWFILLIPVAFGIIVSLLYFQLSSGITLLAIDYAKIILFLVFAILILGINILVFFSISLLTPNSSVSSIVCLLVWIVFVFVLPNISWLIEKDRSPVPGIEEQNRKEASLLQSVKQEIWSGLWKNNPPGEGIYKWKEMCDQREEIHKNVWNEYVNLVFQQTDRSIKLSKISPFMTFKWISDRIADTDYFGYKNFYMQVFNYQNSLRTFINNKDTADPNSYHLFWNSPKPFGTCETFISKNPLQSSEIPYFKYQLGSLKTILSEGLNEIILLFGWFIILFISVYFLFYRYDSR